MAEIGGGIDRGFRFEFDDLGIVQDARDGGVDRGGPELRCGAVRGLGGDRGEAYHGLGAHEVVGNGAEVFDEAADVFGADIDVRVRGAGP